MARLLIVLAFLAAPLSAAVCQGDDPCKACRDCTKCAHCTSGKGSCGVIRAQTAEAARKRLQKQAIARAGKVRL